MTAEIPMPGPAIEGGMLFRRRGRRLEESFLYNDAILNSKGFFMKGLAAFLILAFLFQSSFALADEDRGEKDKDGNRGQGTQRKMNGGRKGNKPQQQHQQRQPKVGNPRP